MRKRYFLLLALLLFITSACTSITSTNDNPEWLNNLISEFANQPVGNPPQSIWQYDYLGQRVFYVPPQCCDQFSTLYDKNGNVMCAPDGGISGTGDGKCSDFFERRTNEKLIWKDTRGK